MAPTTLPLDVQAALRQALARSHLDDCETWLTVRVVYRGRKRRRKEFQKLCRGWAGIVVSWAPGWCPDVRGCG